MVRTVEGTDEGAGAGTQVQGEAPGGTRAWLRSVDFVLVVAIALAAVLRFWHIGGQSIWYDESVTTTEIAEGLPHMLLHTIPKVEGSPPLYPIVAWFWVRIMGDGDGAVRALSAVIGIAAVPVAYAIARELRLSRRIAGITALLVAANPMLVWYSQEARSYSLLLLLGALSILFCIWARNDDRTLNFMLWGLAAGAAVCTHYFAVFVIIPEAAWLGYHSQAQIRRFVYGCVPIVVVGIPMFILVLLQAGGNQEWIADFPIRLRLVEAGRSVVLGSAQPYADWWAVGAVVLIGAVIAAAVLGDPRERTVTGLMLMLGFFGVVVALAGAIFGADFFIGRNVIVSLVPLAVVVAIGLGTRRAGWFGFVVTIAVCLAWSGIVVKVGSDRDLQKPQWEGIAAFLAHGGDDRAVVVDSYLGAPLLRYMKDSRQLPKHELVNVRSIDLLYHVFEGKDHCARWSGGTCDTFMFPLLPKKLAKDFAFAGKVSSHGFTVNRYESQKSVPVSNRMLMKFRKQRLGYVLLPPGGQRPYREPRSR